MRQRVARTRRQDAGQRRQVGHRLGQQVDAVGAEGLHRAHVGRRMQHAARQARVQRGEAGADLLPQQLVLHAGQAVGVAGQQIEPLRIVQQRAATHLVLQEQRGHRLHRGQCVHAVTEVQAQRLCAPAGHQAQAAQRGQVIAQRDVVGGQAAEGLGQFGALARADQAGTVGRVGGGLQLADQRRAGGCGGGGTQVGRGAEVGVLGPQRQVQQAQPLGRLLECGQGLAQMHQQLGRAEQLPVGGVAPICPGGAQPGLQRRLALEGALGLVQRLAEGARCIDAVDLGGQLAGLRGAAGVLHLVGIGAHRVGIGGAGAAVDLHPQRLEAGVAVGQRRGQVAHLLGRCVVGTVRQQAGAGAQRQEAPLGPGRLPGQGDQQPAGAVTLVFLLHRAAVELRLAQHPAVVGGHQVFLDQPLRQLVGEGLGSHGLVRVDAGQQRGHLQALGAQLAGAVAVLAVLPALLAAGLVLAGAAEVLRRQHAAIAAEPLDAGERPAWAVLHLGDPAPGLGRAVAGRRGAAGGEGGAAQCPGRQHAGMSGPSLGRGRSVHAFSSRATRGSQGVLVAAGRRPQPSTSCRTDQRGGRCWAPRPSTQ